MSGNTHSSHTPQNRKGLTSGISQYMNRNDTKEKREEEKQRKERERESVISIKDPYRVLSMYVEHQIHQSEIDLG